MPLQYLGAILIIGCSSAFGFQLSAGQLREYRMLKGLMHALRIFGWELRFRMTPLEALFLHSAPSSGSVGKLFREFSRELESRIYPDAESCVRTVLSRHSELPPRVREILTAFAAGLGRFDLDGQLEGVGDAQALCREALVEAGDSREERQRCYRILGVCAGISLAIVLL